MDEMASGYFKRWYERNKRNLLAKNSTHEDVIKKAFEGGYEFGCFDKQPPTPEPKEPEYRLLAYMSEVPCIVKSVRKLWEAIEDGRYDSRSLVGDEVLNMKEALERLGQWSGPIKEPS